MIDTRTDEVVRFVGIPARAGTAIDESLTGSARRAVPCVHLSIQKRELECLLHVGTVVHDPDTGIEVGLRPAAVPL